MVLGTLCLCYVRQSALPPPVMHDNACYRRQCHILFLSHGRGHGRVRRQEKL